MKKLLLVLASGFVLLGVSFPAQATIITFDEPGISLTDTITTQYSSPGINWIDNPFTSTVATNQVALGTTQFFNNTFSSDEQFLYYNGDLTGGTAVEGSIFLDSYATTLSFDYRRSKSSGNMQFVLYDYDPISGAASEVFNTGEFIWGVNTADRVWTTFSYGGANGDYNLVLMYSPTNQKFMIDNLAVNEVPIPSAFMLMGSGLMLLVGRRLKK